MWLRKHRGRNLEEAKQALEDAEEHFEKVKARGPEVEQVTRAVREIREKNHFADQLYVIMTGSPHGG